MFKFKRISVDDAKQLMDSRQFQLVDIRDDASFEAGHIETAELLNNSNLHDYINRADFDKPLLVC